MGFVAIVATLINIYLFSAGKDYKFAMAMALSFTALTICADYSYLNRWIQVEDWAALMDVVPAMSRLFWFLTIASIFINVLPIFIERRDKKRKLNTF